MNLILGAGLSGLSCSYHLGHENCLLLEAKAHAYGHIHTKFQGGFTWDEGPHVSFTKNDYVKALFAANVENAFDEYDVLTTNYFQGQWIEHPAQSNLHQIPEPLRSQCLYSFLDTRGRLEISHPQPKHYGEWLEFALGKVFSDHFPSVYTRKYWTRDPEKLTTDWVGGRVFYPEIEDVIKGSEGPLSTKTHYITTVRYPQRGGYEAFAKKLAENCNMRLNAGVDVIDLENKKVHLRDKSVFAYDHLINTLPLPVFLKKCLKVPQNVREAAESLSCTQLLLVNATAHHPTQRPENWIYVYDSDKYSTRINCTEKLTPGNAPSGWTGVQVEVYSSRHRPLEKSSEEIGTCVQNELIEMKLLCPELLPKGESLSHHLQNVPWANVIFDHETRPALAEIWHWLESQGLQRESDDLHPLTDWNKKFEEPTKNATLQMAGRFGQWKYFWTDDCVLRGKWIGRNA